MIDFNFYVVFLAGLIPMLTGFIYYHPKVMGSAWMREAGMTEEQMKGSNMTKILLMAYVFGVMAAMGLMSIVIHQMGVGSLLADEPGMKDPNSEVSLWFQDFVNRYGNHYRTFKHGAFHGVLAGVFLALPLIGMNSLFERRSAKYILIHTGYWMLTLGLIGGVICQFM